MEEGSIGERTSSLTGHGDKSETSEKVIYNLPDTGNAI
jgi:hypothetical protein